MKDDKMTPSMDGEGYVFAKGRDMHNHDFG